MVTTRLPARYIIHKELKALLRRKFGGNYKVIEYGDYIEVSAPRQLTEAEVDLVTWVE